MTGIQLEVEALLASFQINETELRAHLNGPEGPVMQDLSRRAINIESAAKRNATGRPGPMVRTGRLRDSITWRLGSDANGPYADIGTNVLYAPYVEFGHGNTPHVYPILTAGGSATGQFGYVSDRRTPEYPFLRPAMESARIEG